MRTSIIKKVVASTVLLGAFASQVANAVEIDKIVIFGDSLSDNGNVYALTKAAHDLIPAIPVIPQAAYYNGRFSNGPVWIEDLAASMNVELNDYAYGGAWVEPINISKINMPISLGMQVNFFLVKAATDYNTSKHLYVIWAGGNDYIKGCNDIDYSTTNTVNIIQNQIDWLRMYGAKNFLVLNLPDLSVVPQVVAEGSAAVLIEKQLTDMHNQKLASMLDEERAAHPEDKIVLGDLTAYMDDVVANPEKYNLKDVKDSCFGGGYYFNLKNVMNSQEINAASAARIDIMNNSSMHEAYVMSKLAEAGAKSCENPDEYLFWDHLHPTRIMHQIISTTTQQLLYANDIKGKDRV